MSKLTLNDLVNLQNETSAVTLINSNSSDIEDALENTLSRDGTNPNQMGANLDMNSNRILNLPAAVSSLEPLRLTDLDLFTHGTATFSNMPIGGTTGQVLEKNSSGNYDASWKTLTTADIAYDASDISYTAPLTGAVLRNASEKMSDVLNGTDYGVVGDHTADDTVALQNLINAAQTLQLPARFTGSCKITSTLNITDLIDFGSDGIGEIRPPHDLSAIKVNTPAPVYLHDFYISYQVAADLGISGIFVTAPSTENSGSLFSRLYISGTSIGIDFQRASQWVLENSRVSASAIGVNVQNLNNHDSGDSTIISNVISTGNAAQAGIRFQSSDGLRIINNKIIGIDMQAGIYLNWTPAVGGGDFFVTGNSIEGLATTGASIVFDRTSGGFFQIVAITGNEFGGGRYGVLVTPDAGGPWLYDVSITGNTCQLANDANAVAFYLAAVDNATISGNSVSSTNANTRLFLTDTTSTAINIGVNSTRGPFAASVFATNTVPCNLHGLDSSTDTGATWGGLRLRSITATPTAAGAVPSVLMGLDGVGIFWGTASPNAALTAPKGSLFIRTDGSSVATRMYVNTDGGTTWTNFTTAA